MTVLSCCVTAVVCPSLAAECTCDDGYIVNTVTGQCSTQFPCADGLTFCLNSGTCTANGDACECGDFSGTNCETRKIRLRKTPVILVLQADVIFIICLLVLGDFCDGNECDHGVCVAHEDTATHSCHCEPGWMGANCDMQTCIGDTVCQNGAACG